MTNLQQQAPDKATHRHYLPGDTHIWVMVLGDLVIFGAYFLIFMVYRAMNAHQYLHRYRAPREMLGHRRPNKSWMQAEDPHAGAVKLTGQRLCQPRDPGLGDRECGDVARLPVA